MSFLTLKCAVGGAVLLACLEMNLYHNCVRLENSKTSLDLALCFHCSGPIQDRQSPEHVPCVLLRWDSGDSSVVSDLCPFGSSRRGEV